MESKQHTPSVIARLMGLDEMPPQQPANKRHRVLSENYLRKTASIGVREKRSTYEGRSFRMNIEEQQEFKDIFEVPVTPKMDKHCNQLVQKGKAKSSLTEAKASFTRQKFTDVKCLSVDKNFQHSKELVDAVEVLDSNKDLVLRTSEKTAEQGNVKKLQRKLENGFPKHLCEELGVNYSHKLSKFQLESKDGICLSPTRIVVLKPNFGKAQNATRSFYPSGFNEGSLPCDRKHKDFCSLENGELCVGVEERKKLDNNMEFSRHNFRVSRELAKEITRQMKNSIRSSSTDMSKSGFSGDGASADETELMMPSSHIFSDWKSQYQNSVYYSNGCSVNRETKKRLSERWKITKRFQEVGLSSRGSTLGEMLAMHDQEKRPKNLDFKLSKHGLSNRFGLSDEVVTLGSPLGISSRDGWKDGCVSDFPRSRSLPTSSTATGSPKTWTRREALHCNWYLRPEEAAHRGQHKSRKQNFDQKDVLKPRSSRSSCKKSLSFHCMDLKNNHTVQQTCAFPNEMKSELVGKDLPKQNSVVPELSSHSVTFLDSENHTGQETQFILDELKNNFEEGFSEQNSVVPRSSVSSVASISMAADTVADAETQDASMCFGSPKQWQSEPMDCIFSEKDREFSSGIQDPTISQETSIGSLEEGTVPSQWPIMGTESPGSSDEAYQPSPVSVLDPLLKEEISSGSECFESISADLRGLQMQLKLLKSESSEAYSEGPGMIVSSDEDTREGSVGLPEEHGELMGLFRAEGSRDFSYLVDVLVEAGSHDGNWDMNFETWHSPECPLSPLVFKVLENKYGEQISWKRSERRLLFDRINSGLMEILQPCVSMYKWAKPVRKRVGSRWSREVIEEELWMLLVNQEKELSKNTSEKVLGRDMRWLELGDEIDKIGREIERLLIDELAEEAVSIENFEL